MNTKAFPVTKCYYNLMPRLYRVSCHTTIANAT